jgi:hypothetical protein
MEQSQLSITAGKTHAQQPLQKSKPSTQPSVTYMTASPAMTITWISFVASGILNFYIWTDACFYGMPEFIAAFLPRPLPMLAIFWSHIIPVAWIANRDGKKLIAKSQSIKPCTKQPSTAVITSSPAMTLAWISAIASGISTGYIWTDGCFCGITEPIAAFLPRPLPMLAILWLHVLLIILIADRDGKRLRAAGHKTIAASSR